MSANRELASTLEPAPLLLAGATDVQLMLPVFEQQVTAIGYHPGDSENVVVLTPNGHQLNGSFISTLGQVQQSDGPGYFIMGDDGRPGSATGSLDVGAPAGTVVFSPVNGTIAGIRSYNLNGECPDTEIKIQPQNHSNLLVVMTHMGNVEATLGQPVRAGQTQLGAVRKLDGCIEQQLGRYTYDYGNHVHLQAEYLANNTKP